MIKRLAVLMSVLLVLLLFAVLPPARAAGSPTAQSMLTTYYNDISLRLYSDAYPMWSNPPSYADLVAGYATTAQVIPYLGDYQAVDGSSGYVPGVLVGYHTDGRIASYQGCFKVASNPAQAAGWSIAGASFDLLENDLPDNDLILSYLTLDCRSSELIFPTEAATEAAPPSDLTTKAYNVLTTYYELVNKKDFVSAYALWLHPLPGVKPNGAPPADYRLPFDSFVAGYVNTKFVDVYTGIYDEQGGYMGHGYVNGEMPVLLVGEHNDGTYVSYIGCYVMGGMVDVPFGIISGAFQQVSAGPDVPSLIEYLPSLKTICAAVSGDLKF